MQAPAPTRPLPWLGAVSTGSAAGDFPLLAAGKQTYSWKVNGSKAGPRGHGRILTYGWVESPFSSLYRAPFPARTAVELNDRYDAWLGQMAAENSEGGFGGFVSGLVQSVGQVARQAIENPILDPVSVGIEKATGVSAVNQLEAGAVIGAGALAVTELSGAGAVAGGGGFTAEGPAALTGAGTGVTGGGIALAGIPTGLTTGSAALDAAASKAAWQQVQKHLAKKPATPGAGWQQDAAQQAAPGSGGGLLVMAAVALGALKVLAVI